MQPIPLPRLRGRAGWGLSALLDLVGRRRFDDLARVVLVEAQRDVLAAGLGLDVLDRVAVALADIRVEGVAILVLGRRVPGLPAWQTLLANVPQGGYPAEAVWLESRGARLGHPLAVPRNGAVVVGPLEIGIAV